MPYRIDSVKKLRNNNRKKYYKPIKYPEIPVSINDLYVITSDNDRLDLLANQFYKDVDLWWVISTANPNIIRRDSFNLKPGIEIRIPQNIQGIIENFQQTNK
tara:strand:- start:2043 stop:2348 length:306 start_codon:yes stop_codon:yes gene_type:complete